jgi:hypothetical protein
LCDRSRAHPAEPPDVPGYIWYRMVRRGGGEEKLSFLPRWYINCSRSLVKKIPQGTGGGEEYMMMRGRTAALFIAAVFAVQAAPSAVSFAKGGRSGSGPTTATGFKAKLRPAAGSLIDCEGKAQYSKKVNSLTLASNETFGAEVECAAADPASAQADIYDLHLARTGADYAVCTLVIKELEFQYDSDPLVSDGIEAEYAVSVGQKSPPTPPVPTAKVGGCTLPDLVTPVIPAVQAGDTASVFLHPDTTTALLTGTFIVGFDD